MAAGLGYIEFSTGDVLTAAQANGYLASQVVMVFASSAARTTAIASPQEGMLSYLKDTNAVEAYDGTNWISIGATGDITSVTAGTGLSGGGTSGAVTLAIDTAVTADLSTAQTLTNKTLTSPVLTTPSISTIDAKGDLLAGTANNTIARLGIGTNGQVLTADSAEVTGMKWATPSAGGGGKILQVVTATTSTDTTIASTTWTDTGLSATITPSSTSSRILVLVTQFATTTRSANDQGGYARLDRNGTVIYADNGGEFTIGGASSLAFGFSFAFSYVDSPATTSARTYKTQGKVGTTLNSGQIVFNSTSLGSIVLMEIGA